MCVVCACVCVWVQLVTNNDEALRTLQQLSCYSSCLSSFTVLERWDIGWGTICHSFNHLAYNQIRVLFSDKVTYSLTIFLISCWYWRLSWHKVFNFRLCFQVMKDPSKPMKMHIWMIQRAKKELFWQFSGDKSVGWTW